jgi:hypothetical protein
VTVTISITSDGLSCERGTMSMLIEVVKYLNIGNISFHVTVDINKYSSVYE